MTGALKSVEETSSTRSSESADDGAALKGELGVDSALHRAKLTRALKRQLLQLGRSPGEPLDVRAAAVVPIASSRPVATYRRRPRQGRIDAFLTNDDVAADAPPSPARLLARKRVVEDLAIEGQNLTVTVSLTNAGDLEARKVKARDDGFSSADFELVTGKESLSASFASIASAGAGRSVRFHSIRFDSIPFHSSPRPSICTTRVSGQPLGFF